jgi:hypothetical protein
VVGILVRDQVLWGGGDAAGVLRLAAAGHRQLAAAVQPIVGRCFGAGGNGCAG